MRLLATGFLLAEGPTLLDDGTVAVSDALGGGVRRLAPDGDEAEPLAGNRKGIGELALDSDGHLIASGREVVLLDGDEPRVLLPRAEGVTGYNDLAATPDGGVLAGALHYSPFAGEAPRAGSLRHRPPGGEPSVWHEGVVWPNGIGFSPDGSTVYVCDFSDGSVYAGAWRPEGPGALKRWAASPSGHADGLAIAADGSVLVATGPGGALAWLSPEGALRELIDVPANFVSSVCFAGPDLDQLVVTTMDNTVRPEQGGAVFLARAPVAGAPVPRCHG